MSRRLLLVLAALLVLPIAGFAAIVGHQEYLRASAPVITVMITSLIDPPCARRTALKSARSARTLANRRKPLVASFSGDRGAGLTVCHTISSA